MDEHFEIKGGGGVVEKRGRRKRNPCPMRLCLDSKKWYCSIVLVKKKTFYNQEIMILFW
jgi:hypothetical protein